MPTLAGGGIISYKGDDDLLEGEQGTLTLPFSPTVKRELNSGNRTSWPLETSTTASSKSLYVDYEDKSLVGKERSYLDDLSNNERGACIVP